jgi:hypothetical protein
LCLASHRWAASWAISLGISTDSSFFLN